MFDAGLLSMQYDGDAVRLVISRDLSAYDLGNDESASRLKLISDKPIILPHDKKDWPDPQALEFHYNRIFKP